VLVGFVVGVPGNTVFGSRAVEFRKKQGLAPTVIESAGEKHVVASIAAYSFSESGVRRVATCPRRAELTRYPAVDWIYNVDGVQVGGKV
jgi:hypothetical protein